MFSSTVHNSKRSMRRMIAATLTVVYLVIALSPLAPFAMYSKVVAHAVTGECSGDCDICGCSKESRANHTCCCAKKKQMQARNIQLSSCEHCVKKAAPAAQTDQPTPPAVAMKECCAKNKPHQDDGKIHKDQNTNERSKNEIVFKCGSPCGKGKILALAHAGSSELLPYIYSERIGITHEDTRYTTLSQRMASRHADPPDPPPRLQIYS